MVVRTNLLFKTLNEGNMNTEYWIYICSLDGFCSIQLYGCYVFISFSSSFFPFVSPKLYNQIGWIFMRSLLSIHLKSNLLVFLFMFCFVSFFFFCARTYARFGPAHSPNFKIYTCNNVVHRMLNRAYMLDVQYV